VGTWYDPELGRPIAAPLERCAELLGVDLATIRTLGRRRRALPPCGQHQGLEPDAAGATDAAAGLPPAARRLPGPATNPDGRHRATGRRRRQQGRCSVGAAWLDQRGGRLAGQLPGADSPGITPAAPRPPRPCTRTADGLLSRAAMSWPMRTPHIAHSQPGLRLRNSSIGQDCRVNLGSLPTSLDARIRVARMGRIALTPALQEV
jgi:hypothetical protein